MINAKLNRIIRYETISKRNGDKLKANYVAVIDSLILQFFQSFI